MKMSYLRFAAMIATSTVVMFALMYLHTYAFGHVRWSQTRAWMAVLMGATMAIVMLGFMWRMYGNRRLNVAIMATGAGVFALSLWLVRSQATVDDTSYMRAMIPHHSIAILTSSRARITDPRVRKLADEIIAAQQREIAEMAYLIARLESGAAGGGSPRGAAPVARVVPAHEAIRSAELATTDLAAMDAAGIARVIGEGRTCGFRYAAGGEPVIAYAQSGAPGGGVRGVVKLHGLLVELSGAVGTDGSVRLQADGITVGVAPAAKPGAGDAMQPATATMQLEAGLSVGYAGFHGCSDGEAAASR